MSGEERDRTRPDQTKPWLSDHFTGVANVYIIYFLSCETRNKHHSVYGYSVLGYWGIQSLLLMALDALIYTEFSKWTVN